MQLHIVEVSTTLLLAMLMMPMQASASFGYSKKSRPDYCKVINVSSVFTNQDTPKTWQEMMDNHSSEYEIMPPGKSIWHNLRENLDTTTLEKRIDIAMQSLIEYYTKPPAEWKYLNPDWPNIKYVEKNGHREMVYNMRTGAKVDSGINQGTENISTSQGLLGNLVHVADIFNWIRCAQPSELDSIFVQMGHGGDELKKMIAQMPPYKRRMVEEYAGLEKGLLDVVEQAFNRIDSINDGSITIASENSHANHSVDNNIDLSNLDFEDESYDWCKCMDPGCFTKSLMGFECIVSFVCSKCGKVNRAYAKRAVEMERKAKEKGIDTLWFGENAEEKAKSAL